MGRRGVEPRVAPRWRRLLGGTRPAGDVAAPTLGDSLRRSRRACPTATTRARLPPSAPVAIPAAAHAARRLRRDWWIHSFSQLHRQKPHGVHALQEEAPADRRTPARRHARRSAFEAVDPRFRGERFGNAVHHALEHADFAGLARPRTTPRRRRANATCWCSALQSQDYPADEHRRRRARTGARWSRATLNAPLPEGGRLCDLPPSARVAEIEFHFALADADSAALLALLHAHGIALERRDFGAWPRLSGLMTGKIDLTYVNGGRVLRARLQVEPAARLRRGHAARAPCAPANTTCRRCCTWSRCTAGCACAAATVTTTRATSAACATCSAAASIATQCRTTRRGSRRRASMPR